MQVTLNPVALADIKKAAEDALLHRLETISLGERVSLALRASGNVGGRSFSFDYRAARAAGGAGKSALDGSGSGEGIAFAGGVGVIGTGSLRASQVVAAQGRADCAPARTRTLRWRGRRSSPGRWRPD